MTVAQKYGFRSQVYCFVLIKLHFQRPHGRPSVRAAPARPFASLPGPASGRTVRYGRTRAGRGPAGHSGESPPAAANVGPRHSIRRSYDVPNVRSPPPTTPSPAPARPPDEPGRSLAVPVATADPVGGVPPGCGRCLVGGFVFIIGDPTTDFRCLVGPSSPGGCYGFNPTRFRHQFRVGLAVTVGAAGQTHEPIQSVPDSTAPAAASSATLAAESFQLGPSWVVKRKSTESFEGVKKKHQNMLLNVAVNSSIVTVIYSLLPFYHY